MLRMQSRVSSSACHIAIGIQLIDCRAHHLVSWCEFEQAARCGLMAEVQ